MENYSFVELSPESMTPELDEARNAPEDIKQRLHYRDGDELEAGMQKVQQLDVLDKEIDRFRAEFRSAAATLSGSAVPTQVVKMVDEVVAIANENSTGVFKASQILEFIFDAFNYGEFASRDTFDLSRRSLGVLKEHDDTLRKVVEERLLANMESAEKLKEECYRKLSIAYREAKEDLNRQRLRAEKDQEKISEEGLRELTKQAADIISLEEAELRTMEEQCKRDLTTIVEGVDCLHQHMDAARREHTQQENKRQQELQRNRKRQAELEEELRLLKARENQLNEELKDGKEVQRKLEKTLVDSEANISDWQENIKDLQRKTSTSLVIMGIMNKCTKVIMEDALIRKQGWTKKLDDLKVEGLLALRDIVMATSIEHMMDKDDCNMNLDVIKSTIKEQESEKMKAAQHGFSKKVKKLTDELEECHCDLSMYEERRDGHEGKLRELREELEQIDTEIAALRPQVDLDTLEGRYSRFKEARDSAFSNKKSLEYCSRADYY